MATDATFVLVKVSRHCALDRGGRGLSRVLRGNKLRIVDESVSIPVVRLHDGVDHVAQLVVLEVV